MSANKSASIALGLIATVVVFYVLAVGKSLLVPIALAVLIWYVINALSRFYQRLIPGRWVPEWLTLIVAVVTLSIMAIFLIELIQRNAAQVVAEAPGYKARIQEILDNTAALFGIQQLPTIKQMMQSLELGPWLSTFAGALTSLIGNVGLVLIYVLFLLLEQNTFSRKVDALFPSSEHRQNAQDVLQQINHEIQIYLGIKTLLSVTTGLLSYGILRMVGVDYAEFWGVTIFLLNYIPT
ncbi:MAG: AI-2E family transporter, partial [Saprospiraceae bacterium]|nr:AI-2E family transporter [Saprospiraceae bacterium]